MLAPVLAPEFADENRGDVGPPVMAAFGLRSGDDLAILDREKLWLLRLREILLPLQHQLDALVLGYEVVGDEGRALEVVARIGDRALVVPPPHGSPAAIAGKNALPVLEPSLAPGVLARKRRTAGEVAITQAHLL